ncbi:MAG: hypothetical protein NC408_04990 [Candidatus Gastranaerophilales bacterium]|nr:hypothetical protein [Candidatus Gastranaerophilales bacterium]MCM1072308.1 hypothetical protein [Bacteroides sp.]
MGNFDISKLTGLLKTAAEKIDNNGNKNGKIDGIEISIFKNEASTLKHTRQISAQEYNSVFSNDRISADFDLKEQYVCVPDKTRVAQKEPIELQTQKNISLDIYNYKSDPQYERVCNLITKQYTSHGVKKPTQEQIDKIARMVLEKCNKYNVSDLAPVIAQMLGTESGGYVFNDRVLVHSGSQFKGVMQVNLEAICCMYGEQELRDIQIGGINKKTKKPKIVSGKKDKGIYEAEYKKHYSQDAARINELKAKYPTPKDLYLAIQKDPELGLEVGIIVFKAKISASKGSVSGAIAGYCGSQYTCDTSGCPRKIDVSQRA